MSRKKLSSNSKVRIFFTSFLGTIALAILIPVSSIFVRSLVALAVVTVTMAGAILWREKHWERETVMDWSRGDVWILMKWDKERDILYLLRRTAELDSYSPQLTKTAIQIQEVIGEKIVKNHSIIVDEIPIIRGEAVVKRKDQRTITIQQGELIVRVKTNKLVERYFAS